MNLAIIVLILVASSHSITLPHSFKLCNRHQSDFDECVRDAAEYNLRQAIHPFRDLRLPGLKPLIIPALTIGSGKAAVAVEQHFSDCKMYGFDHVEFKTFRFDFEKKTLNIDSHFVEIIKKCHYQLNGRVLLLPIKGEGESTIVLRDVKIAGHLNYEEVERNGKTYLNFDSHDFSLDVSGVYFHFDNLFNGDKALGDALNKVLNDNWKQVFDDVRINYSEAMTSIIKSLCNQFWGRVSLEDAFDVKK